MLFHDAEPRSENAIAQRYTRSLNPALCKGKWTAEEDARLLELLKDPSMVSFGRIANALRTRSDLSVRQHVQKPKMALLLKETQLWRP